MFTIFNHARLIASSLLLLCVSAQSQANTTSPSIEATCSHSYALCLKNIEPLLSSTQQPSRTWYKYKLLQLEALFNLGKITELKQALAPFIHKENLPEAFTVYIKIYYAKALGNDKQRDESKKYIQEALTLLYQIQEQLPRPMRLIEIANLQLIDKQFTQAEQTLLYLEERFSQNALPLFNQELYANLGHVASMTDQLDKLLDYREKSLYYTLQVDNKQQNGVAYYNLGRALFRLEDYASAEENFLLSFKHAELAQDVSMQIYAKIRLAEIALIDDEQDKALKQSAELEQIALLNNFPIDQHKSYQELKVLLTKASRFIP